MSSDKFKPGDRVRLAKHYDGSVIPVGAEGRVRKCDSDGTTFVQFDPHPYPLWVFTSNLELLPPAPDARETTGDATMSDKFKPGDRDTTCPECVGPYCARCGHCTTCCYCAAGPALPPAPDESEGDEDPRHQRDLANMIGSEPPAPDARDSQVGGDHYTRLSVQPWDVIEATATPEGVYWYFVGNALKYLMRAHSKGGLQDIRKARHYLDRLITLVERGKAACGKVTQPEGEQ